MQVFDMTNARPKLCHQNWHEQEKQSCQNPESITRNF